MIYCDDHTHQLKTTSHTQKKTFKTITFIGPVHHTHRNISNKNLYRASTSHTQKHYKQKLFWASTSHTQKHFQQKFL